MGRADTKHSIVPCFKIEWQESFPSRESIEIVPLNKRDLACNCSYEGFGIARYCHDCICLHGPTDPRMLYIKNRMSKGVPSRVAVSPSKTP